MNENNRSVSAQVYASSSETIESIRQSTREAVKEIRTSYREKSKQMRYEHFHGTNKESGGHKSWRKIKREIKKSEREAVKKIKKLRRKSQKTISGIRRESSKLRDYCNSGAGIYRNPGKISRIIFWPVLFAVASFALDLFGITDALSNLLCRVPFIEALISQADTYMQSVIVGLGVCPVGIVPAAVSKIIDLTVRKVSGKILEAPLDALQATINNEERKSLEYFDYGVIKNSDGDVGVMSIIDKKIWLTIENSTVAHSLSSVKARARGIFDNKIELTVKNSGKSYEFRVPMRTAKFWVKRIKKAQRAA